MCSDPAHDHDSTLSGAMETANAKATAGFAMDTKIETFPIFKDKMKIQMFNKFF